jgi:FHS family glucose/mannose:H+ symporter-like MFS transporter
MQRNHSTDDNTYGPVAPLLAFGLLLTGIGTAFLGPILPVLAHLWQMTDQQSGFVIAAKFVGAFLGGLSAPRVLRHGILAGLVIAGLGYTGFALSSGMVLGTIGLFVSGYGVGLGITTINILVGRRYVAHTGSALSTINFFWSLGAVACGFLAAMIVPRYGLHNPMLIYGGLFFATALAGLLLTSHRNDIANDAGDLSHVLMTALSHGIHLHFVLLLFLYGGLETCMTGWLTTYSLRFSDAPLLGGQSAVVLLWAALTAGRVLASAAMRKVSEVLAQRVGLAMSAVFIVAITLTQRSSLLSLYCVLLGLSLAPFFPSTFGLLMKRKPAARQAATVIAASGLGAAVFPWMMGFVSTHSNSLRVAMAVPAALALALLVLSLVGVPGGVQEIAVNETAA